MARKVSKEDKAQALAQLRKLCPPGTTVFTGLRHVSSSGMYRAIQCYIIHDNEPRWISRWVAMACGFRFDEQREAIGVSGCGMDMGFHIVNNLSYVLHGTKDKGDGAKEENQGRPFTPRRGHFRAGYSLSHRWM